MGRKKSGRGSGNADRGSAGITTEARGLDLVREVMAHVLADQDQAARRKPIDEALAARLKFQNGAPLPETLALWLPFNSRGFTIDEAAGVLRPCNIVRSLMLGYGGESAIARANTDRHLKALKKDFEKLKGDFYEVGEFLYLWVGQPAASGEYPILAYGEEEFVQVFPSFALYLADNYGLLHRRTWATDDATFEAFTELEEANPDLPEVGD